jgi:ribosomal protein S18 acetylase RimI-like enzyme
MSEKHTSGAIIPCTGRFEELLEFVARLNGAAAQHIGFFGETRAAIRETLLELEPPIDETFRLAVEDGRLVGVLGLESDPEIGRAWLFGPLIEHDDWQAVADQLYEAVKPIIPAGIHEYELFGDVGNVHLQEFAERHAFPLLGEHAILALERAKFVIPTPRSRVSEYQPAFFEQLEQLHDTLFPHTYFTARQMIEKQDENRKLFILADGEILQGYTFCKAEPETGEGYLDFIGVAGPFQGRGLGKQLLAAALDWIFSVPGIEKVAATVRTSNTRALSLYSEFGFVTRRIMKGYRLKV